MENKILENAVDFIGRAANDLWDERLSPKQQLKYSTIELYEGIELVIKARLIQEHWALVVANFDKYKKDSFLDGSFNSVRFDEACKRLSDFCDGELPKSTRKAFEDLRLLKNRYVHFCCEKPRPEVIAIQIAAWHHILKMLEDEEFLGPLSMEPQELVMAAKAKMLKSEDFLARKYEDLKSELETLRSHGTVVAHCPICDYDSLILGDPGDDCPRCLVCETDARPEQLAEKYAAAKDPFWKHPKHGVDDGIAWCDECEYQAVAPAGDEIKETIVDQLKNVQRESGEDWEYWICFHCGAPQIGPPGACDECGEYSFDFGEDAKCPGCFSRKP